MLELLMFYETRKKPKKAFKVLSCVIYTMIRNYICIDYLACEFKKIELAVSIVGGLIRKKVMTKYLELEIHIC